MAASLFTGRQISEINDALLSTGGYSRELRDILLDGIDPRFRAALPVHDSLSLQLRSDIDRMSMVDAYFRIWIKNVIQWLNAAGLPVPTVFQDTIDRIDKTIGGDDESRDRKHKLAEHVRENVDADDVAINQALNTWLEDDTQDSGNLLEILPWGDVWTGRSSGESPEEQYARLLGWQIDLDQRLAFWRGQSAALQNSPGFELLKRKREVTGDEWEGFLREVAQGWQKELKQLQGQIKSLKGEATSGQSTAPFASGYAVIIGVDACQIKHLALPIVARDVTAVFDVFIHPERCAYNPDNVRLLQGEESTGKNILEAFYWLKEKVQADPEATAVIYYSGHGMVDKKTQQYYLIPYDIQALSRLRIDALKAETVTAEISEIQAKRTLVVLDCCHAQGMDVKDVDLDSGPELDSVAFPDDLPETKAVPAYESGSKDVAELAEGDGRAILNSSTGAESSYVRPDGKMSVFAYHFIEALTGHAPHGETDTVVYVTDVMSWVTRRVKETVAQMGRSQTPVMRTDGVFPIAQLIGGKGVALSKGELAPDPLEMLPESPAPIPTLTDSVELALRRAADMAGDYQRTKITPEMLLVALYSSEEGLIYRLLSLFDDPVFVKIKLRSLLQNSFNFAEEIGGDDVELGDTLVSQNVAPGQGNIAEPTEIGGDSISVGDISNARGVAIGRGATAEANIPSDAGYDRENISSTQIDFNPKESTLTQEYLADHLQRLLERASQLSMGGEINQGHILCALLERKESAATVQWLVDLLGVSQTYLHDLIEAANYTLPRNAVRWSSDRHERLPAKATLDDIMGSFLPSELQNQIQLKTKATPILTKFAAWFGSGDQAAILIAGKEPDPDYFGELDLPIVPDFIEDRLKSRLDQSITTSRALALIHEGSLISEDETLQPGFLTYYHLGENDDLPSNDPYVFVANLFIALHKQYPAFDVTSALSINAQFEYEFGTIDPAASIKFTDIGSIAPHFADGKKVAGIDAGVNVNQEIGVLDGAVQSVHINDLEVPYLVPDPLKLSVTINEVKSTGVVRFLAIDRVLFDRDRYQSALEFARLLIVEPLNRLESTGLLDDQLLILVDGLDHLLNEGDESIPALISDLFHSDELPPEVRFVLTAESTAAIESYFSTDDPAIFVLRADELEEEAWRSNLSPSTQTAFRRAVSLAGLAGSETVTPEILLTTLAMKEDGPAIDLLTLFDDIPTVRQRLADLVMTSHGATFAYEDIKMAPADAISSMTLDEGLRPLLDEGWRLAVEGNDGQLRSRWALAGLLSADEPVGTWVATQLGVTRDELYEAVAHGPPYDLLQAKSSRQQQVYGILPRLDRETFRVGEKAELILELVALDPGEKGITLPESAEIHAFISASLMHVLGNGSQQVYRDPQTKSPLPVRFDIQGRLPGDREIEVKIVVEDLEKRERRNYSRNVTVTVSPMDATIEFAEVLPDLAVRVVRRPDVLIQIDAQQKGLSTYQIDYRLTSRLLDHRCQFAPVGKITLHANDISRLRGLLYAFAGSRALLSPEDMIQRQRSLGMLLFDMLAPVETAGELREFLQKESNKNQSWLIINDGAILLPWEMVIPYQDLEEDQRFTALAAGQTLAQWIDGEGATLYEEIPFGNVAWLDPDANQDQNGHYTLLDESQEVMVDTIQKAMTQSFVHGMHIALGTQERTQTVSIVRRDRTRAEDVDQGSNRLDLRRRRPVVTLSMLQGSQHLLPGDDWLLRQRILPYLRAGVGAVIASWWPTSPASDRLFWPAFYQRLQRRLPVGEALQQARLALRAARPFSPDWLAYSLFGHPQATVYVPAASQGYTAFECLNPDDPLRTGKLYHFSCSIRSEPPIWYENKLVQTEAALPQNAQLRFIHVGADEMPELQPMQLNAAGTMISAVRSLEFTQPGSHMLLAQILDGDHNLETLQLTVAVS